MHLDIERKLTLGSEEMALVQLFIPIEIGRSCVSSLGEAGCVQFLDVRPFAGMGLIVVERVG
jgi:hypothetical protein